LGPAFPGFGVELGTPAQERIPAYLILFASGGKPGIRPAPTRADTFFEKGPERLEYPKMNTVGRLPLNDSDSSRSMGIAILDVLSGP